jgi:YfiH family protein
MEIKRNGKIHFLEPQQFAATGMSVQGFTTRHEGVSRPPYNSLNLGANTLDSPHSVQGNLSLLSRTFGSRVEKLVTVTQVHGTDLLVIDQPNPDFGHFRKLECDGVVTNQPGVMIGVGVADCVPVLLLDPVQQVVAALHAGWQGTAGGIARKGVETLVKLFGSRQADLLAAVGPAIGPCCYEVDEPVRDAFLQHGAGWDGFARLQGGGKWALDLAAANRQQLLDAGVPENRLECAPQCVSCMSDWFFSYRRDKGDTGRQMGFIMLRKAE